MTDRELSKRVKDAKKLVKAIWIEHPPQEANITLLDEYRQENLDMLGQPIDGRRLSEESQAGKSAMVFKLKARLAEEREAAGFPKNPHQIIVVTITKNMTLKGFFQAILKQMGDDFLDSADDRRGTRTRNEDRRTITVLEQRIGEWTKKLGVELLVADEVQRLARAGKDGREVTEQFQTMLDRGVVPLVLIGNAKSREFFEENQDFCARLGMPLDLRPLDATEEKPAELFQEFCRDFDEKLVENGLFGVPSGLDDEDVAEALARISGGHIGRVSRLIQEAVPLAIRRRALRLERYDLSCATRSYAMANAWIGWDPFSNQPGQ
ncbi:AAA family ATPase [Pacificimonas sp. ICDLI1SI03]